MRVNNLFYSLNDLLWFDEVHAGQVASAAGPFAVDAARATVEVDLYGVLGWLVPSHEAAIAIVMGKTVA